MSYRDTFTEADVLRCLDFAGERYRVQHKSIVTTCPMPEHEDHNPSAEIFRDNWFVSCYAGCGRFHITKAYPELRDNNNGTVVPQTRKNPMPPKKEEPKKHVDLIEKWRSLPLIPRDHTFKSIPLEVLDYMGWRWDENKDSYFIPYFDSTQEHIPFAQYRRLHYTQKSDKFRPVEARITPPLYGKWNLPDASMLFLVEGSSDAACLEYAGVPWVAVPSCSSTTIAGLLADYCISKGIRLVYAGDKDANNAGDKIRHAIEARMPRFRTCQPPKQYKDWCDFLDAEGIDTVREYTNPELGVPSVPVTEPLRVSHAGTGHDRSLVEEVVALFPGAEMVAA